MKRSILSLVLATSLAALSGCAAETSTGTEQSEQTVVEHRAHLAQPGDPQRTTGSQIDQQSNFDLRPDTEVSGPVPDPWVGAGPVPDPWNPGGGGDPKRHAIQFSGPAADDATPSSNKK
jgi:hypothetical protein